MKYIRYYWVSYSIKKEKTVALAVENCGTSLTRSVESSSTVTISTTNTTTKFGHFITEKF